MPARSCSRAQAAVALREGSSDGSELELRTCAGAGPAWLAQSSRGAVTVEGPDGSRHGMDVELEGLSSRRSPDEAL